MGPAGHGRLPSGGRPHRPVRAGLATAATFAAVAAALLAGCASGPPGSVANASVKAKYGLVPSGVVQFDQKGPDTVVYVHFAGLPTNAEHAMHIHEKGDCTGADLTGAGGIYNPTNKPHGPQNREHMVGDLPSIFANNEGIADARYVIPGLKVSDLIGRSVIVHRFPDDYRTQPEGDSGERIACGIIRG